MNKIGIFGAILAVLAVVGLIWFNNSNSKSSATGSVVDYKSATFTIEGQSVIMVDGRSEKEAVPGSATKVTTKYFGNDAKGDLNGDGIPDLAFLVTQESGGSGVFYYVVGAIQQADGGYKGTDGVLLGDRIAPQTTEIKDGKVFVNYAERKKNEPMTAKPSVGKTLVVKLSPGTMQFGLVVQDFEGESNLPN